MGLDGGAADERLGRGLVVGLAVLEAWQCLVFRPGGAVELVRWGSDRGTVQIGFRSGGG